MGCCWNFVRDFYNDNFVRDFYDDNFVRRDVHITSRHITFHVLIQIESLSLRENINEVIDNRVT